MFQSIRHWLGQKLQMIPLEYHECVAAELDQCRKERDKWYEMYIELLDSIPDEWED